MNCAEFKIKLKLEQAQGNYTPVWLGLHTCALGLLWI